MPQKKNKKRTSLSKSATLQELADFWDTHDLADYEDKTRDAHFDVNIKRVKRYVALDSELALKIQDVAHKRGIHVETLVHLWLQQQINKVKSGKSARMHLARN